MRENGRMVKNMVKEQPLILMDQSMLEDGKMIKNMVKVNTTGLMVVKR